MAGTRLTCPSCAANLKLATELAPGKKVKCPKCATIITVPAAGAEAQMPAPPPKPAATPPAKTAPKPAQGVQRPRPAAPPPPREEAEENDFEQITEKPRKPAARPGASEDDDEELLTEKPVKKGKKKASPLMFWGVVGGVAAVGAIAFVGFMWWMGVFSSSTGPITKKFQQKEGPTYTVKIKLYPDVGKSVSVDELIASSEAEDEKNASSIKNKSTLTVITAGEPRPKKYKQTYKKAVFEAGGKEIPRALQGRTLIFELENDKYDVTAAGVPPLEKKDFMDVTQQANRPIASILFPKAAVKEGDTWPADFKVLKDFFDLDGEMDEKASTAQVELERVDEKTKVGVIKGTFKLVFRSLTGKKLDGPATFDFTLTLEAPIDGSSTARTVKGEGTMREPIGKGDDAKEKVTKISTKEEVTAETDTPADKEEPLPPHTRLKLFDFQHTLRTMTFHKVKK